MRTVLVLLLVGQLGSPKWRSREAAHKLLASGLPYTARAVYAGRESSDLEVRSRCRQITARYELQDAGEHALKLLGGSGDLRTYPWLSGVPQVSTFVQKARQVMAHRTGAPDWWEYRVATRLWARSQVVQRRPAAEIRKALADMWSAEGHWQEKQQRKHGRD